MANNFTQKMASNQTSNQTYENQDDNQWPRFLIMEAADPNIPLNLNAFVLKKAIDGMANAELDNVKHMKSGRVFIEVETKQQCKNLLKTTKLLGYSPVIVSPHRTLNSSKFVIKCEELDKMDEEEIKKELQPQGIIDVKRIAIRYSLYFLTIKGQTIPKKINIYISKVIRKNKLISPFRSQNCSYSYRSTRLCGPHPITPLVQGYVALGYYTSSILDTRFPCSVKRYVFFICFREIEEEFNSSYDGKVTRKWLLGMLPCNRWTLNPSKPLSTKHDTMGIITWIHHFAQ